MYSPITLSNDWCKAIFTHLIDLTAGMTDVALADYLQNKAMAEIVNQLDILSGGKGKVARNNRQAHAALMDRERLSKGMFGIGAAGEIIIAVMFKQACNRSDYVNLNGAAATLDLTVTDARGRILAKADAKFSFMPTYGTNRSVNMQASQLTPRANHDFVVLCGSEDGMQVLVLPAQAVRRHAANSIQDNGKYVLGLRVDDQGRTISPTGHVSMSLKDFMVQERKSIKDRRKP